MIQCDKDRVDQALFEGFLRTQGLSLTNERKDILQKILEFSKAIKHFSINRLYIAFQEKGSNISKSTLYRTIKLLEDSRILKKTDIASDRYIYEKVVQNNIGHLVCLKCDRIIKINQKVIMNHINQICKNKRFQYKTHVFEIKGTCYHCISLLEIS